MTGPPCFFPQKKEPASILVAILFLSLLWGGCNGRGNPMAEAAWERAFQADNRDVYEKFIEDHPGSPHVSQALDQLLAQALRQNTLEACDAFSRKHSGTPQADEASKKLDELFGASVPSLRGELESSGAVSLSWGSMPFAESYRVYWTRPSESGRSRGDSTETNNTGMVLHPDPSLLPLRYFVVALRAGKESQASNSKVIEPSGSYDEDCGCPAGQGQSHMPAVGVGAVRQMVGEE